MSTTQPSLLSRLKGKLAVGIAVGGLVYLVMMLYSGWGELKDALATFNWWLFPLLLVLAFANYMFRFLKWHFYLGRLSIDLRRSDSLIVFLSGLVMTISPGKIGELLKSVLLKQLKGTPISVSAPIVVGERITDFVALVFISLAGLTVFTVEASSLWVLSGFSLLLLAFVALISNRTLSLGLIGLIEKLGPLRRVGDKLHSMYDSTYRLLRFWPLLVATFWSVLAWLCECLGFWITLSAFTDDPQLLAAAFIYALGTILGVVSPGGLGPTEASMIGMLQSQTIMGAAKMTKAPASAATLIIRLATLWFAVAVGAVVLILFQGRFAGAADELEAELDRAPAPENPAE
ncbi:MAG: lysylphosphatidylglycerol synthase transmembrane domain-containing protein [Candidatus Lernaella stagnicola]|nr:lysylphosphatidylglycerol synthase transmembrane domain-containing protein [Candidatus Lernaella stagnicola]